MNYFQGKYKIAKKLKLNDTVYDFTLSCKEITDIAIAGQFVHIAVDGFSLRRPISICEINREKGWLRIVFEVRGKGTEALSKLCEGDLMDVIGPLGKGFDLLKPGKKCIAIGGGIGTPPMLEVAKHYGADCTVISGFRTGSIAILQEDFADTGAKTILCTDDGSAGRKGFVTEALEECLNSEKPDIICACGPMPMLKAIVELAKNAGIRTQVSLEQRMACGVGACLVCACRCVKDGEEFMAHVCKDGPVFEAEEVVF